MATCAKRVRGLVYFSTLLMIGCFDRGEPLVGEPDRTVGPGYSIDESSLTAEVAGAGLEIAFGVHRFGGTRGSEVDLSVELADLDGNVIARGAETAALPIGVFRARVKLPTGAEIADADQGRYVLHYRLDADGREIGGRRSLLVATRRLAATILSTDVFFHGAKPHLRVVARDPGSGAALAGAAVEVGFDRGQSGVVSLGTGTTDATGTLALPLSVPTDFEGTGQLRVVVRYGDRRAAASFAAAVRREARILLTTDKPLYQPGQRIHLRSLALRRTDNRPEAERALVFEVLDGKGNKVFKEHRQTDAYGIASAQFDLATQVNLGRYTVRAILGETSVEKAVTVDRYALPKFGVQVAPDRSFYLPGETVRGEVRARYFFGRALAGASVVVRGETFDVQPVPFGEVHGVTNAEGSFVFNLPLPQMLVGLPLDQGKARVLLRIAVTDTAGQEESVDRPVTVAQSGLLATLIPEGASPVPGLEQTVFVLTADPSGAPRSASGTVTVRHGAGQVESLAVRTDSRGFAEIKVTPSAASGTVSFSGTLSDDRGYNARISFSWGGGSQSSVGSLLLRPDRSLYQVGETARFLVLARGIEDRVYLDVVRGGQTVVAQTLVLDAGRASFDLELDETLCGTLQVHAYYLGLDSQMVRDTRAIFVKSSGGLAVDLEPDRQEYRPRDTARVAIRVRDQEGRGVPAALGVHVVDEAVFARSENQPGLEGTFFGIEGEVMKPKIEVEGWSFAEAISGEPNAAREQTARVLFAAAGPGAGYAISHDTWTETRTRSLTHARARVDKDAEIIAKAIDEFAKASLWTDPEQAAARFVEDNRERWFDPWGQLYLVTLERYLLRVTSGGFDERRGTEDDVIVVRYFSPGHGDLMPNARGEDDANFGAVPGAPAGGGASAGPTAQPSVTVREFFPETLLVAPNVITDPSGMATLEVPLADSITSWRVSSLASSLLGWLGSATIGLKVFQDFFVDIDFPATLTRGDEVSVPLAIYNYLEAPQEVRLVAEGGQGFELLEAAEKTITVAGSSVSGASFRVRTAKVGRHDFTVWAYGSRLSDAVRRRVEIVPDGKRFATSASDLLKEEIVRRFTFPEGTVPGGNELLLKVYPGVFSQAVEGLDSILQMPSGCFEQTSSTTYPNVLVLAYLRETGRVTPEIEMKAKSYINAGYQRLLTFEVDGGGFEWFGHSPANQVLTAYGLMEFRDMARVHPVDEAMIARTRAWLVGKQNADGSFTPDASYYHQDVWGTMQQASVLATSYITWALLASGARDAAVDKAVAFLKANRAQAADAYGKALLANALVVFDPADPVTQEVLTELADLAVVEGGSASWPARGGGMSYSKGDVLKLETTALAAYALIRAGAYPELVQGAITFLLRNKDELGNWYATQATVLALKTLLASITASQGPADATVGAMVNGVAVPALRITPDNQDVLRLVDLTPHLRAGENEVRLAMAGTGNLAYQLTATYYLPWAAVGGPPQEPITLRVEYDRTTLAVNDRVQVTATVTNNVPGSTVNMALVDLGLPPGFDLIPDELQAAVSAGRIERFERTDRQLIIYVRTLTHGTPLVLRYALRARMPLRAEAPPSRAYAYYNPSVSGVARPVMLVVQ
jgi:hypothetical protein